MLSGSIAAYKACNVISDLVQNACEVQVVCTPSARHFVGDATLEGLTGRRVLYDIHEPGAMMEHIHLAEWCDLAVLCPASAHTINSLSLGLADSLVGALFLALPKTTSFLLAPAMNSKMLKHPATEKSLSVLQGWGVEILETGTGQLACGEVGAGRLLEPDELLFRILQKLKAPASKGRILITAGGTREAIDGVRSICNTSTGATGVALAEHFIASGYEVTFLHGEGSLVPQSRCNLLKFSSCADLEQALRLCLEKYEYLAVVHAAAVSDYTVESIEISGQEQQASSSLKLSSKTAPTLRLKPTTKILPKIKDFAGSSSPCVIGFKLTCGASEEEKEEQVARLLSSGTVDWVVQNDLDSISQDTHLCKIYESSGLKAECRTKSELAKGILALL